MKINDNNLICYYLMGMELASQEDSKFPDWFQYAEEKYAFLLGYNDYDCGIRDKSEEEILKELKKI